MVEYRRSRRLLDYTGPELAVQEVLYGFIMALTFIVAARVGILSYDSPWKLVTMILAMNFVWGAIDMIIFYRVDVSTQKRYAKLISEDRNDPQYRKEIYDELSNTIFDVLDEEDKVKGVDVVVNGKVESRKAMWEDRRVMLLSAVTCFIITVLTALPVIAALVMIKDPTDALDYAALLASVSLFFVGYYLEPEGSHLKRISEGLVMMGFAAVLSLFAAYFGG